MSSLSFSPDGRFLASGGMDGTIQLWELTTNQQIGSALPGHGAPVSWLAFSAQGGLVSIGIDGSVRWWSAVGPPQDAGPLVGPEPGAADEGAFSPDGRLLTLAGTTMQTWDPASRRQVGRPVRLSPSDAYAFAFSPDGRSLATSSAAGTLQLVVRPPACRSTSWSATAAG